MGRGPGCAGAALLDLQICYQKEEHGQPTRGLVFGEGGGGGAAALPAGSSLWLLPVVLLPVPDALLADGHLVDGGRLQHLELRHPQASLRREARTCRGET